MLIAQISDTHICPAGQMTCGVAPMQDHLQRLVDHLNAQDPRPDVVLLSGDVTQNGTLAEARTAADILSALAIPVFIVPGNHDDPEVLAQVFPPESGTSLDAGFADYTVEGFAVRIIALNTARPGHPGGRLTPAQLDWLSARLNEMPEKPTVIVGHHPPLDLGVPETNEDGFIGSTALGALIADHPNVERYVCGHIHLHTNTRWNGTMVTTAPSLGMQLTLALGSTAPSQFYLSEPAYLLHHWTDDCTLITHHVQLAPVQGPFDF